MGTWRTLEHTADLALEARGATAAEAVEALCQGLLAQVTDPAAVEPRAALEIAVDGFDASETLVSALGELLYQVNDQGWLFSAFAVAEASAHHLALTALGEPRDPARHPLHLEIKAATYHDLAWEETAEGWIARVLFDV